MFPFMEFVNYICNAFITWVPVRMSAESRTMLQTKKTAKSWKCSDFELLGFPDPENKWNFKIEHLKFKYLI